MPKLTARERLRALADAAADLIEERERALFTACDLEVRFLVTDAGRPVESVVVNYEVYGDSGDIVHAAERIG